MFEPHVQAELVRWRELNTAEDFTRIAHVLHSMSVTPAQVLHHKVWAHPFTQVGIFIVPFSSVHPNFLLLLITLFIYKDQQISLRKGRHWQLVFGNTKCGLYVNRGCNLFC
jgi:hypothetical protein